MATYDQEGKRVRCPVFPWRVRAEPSGDFTTGADHLGDLQTIPAGSTLYNLYADDMPCEIGGTEHYIGKLVTTSEFTTSFWGDEHLKFRH